jgi:hypothetical protein
MLPVIEKFHVLQHVKILIENFQVVWSSFATFIEFCIRNNVVVFLQHELLLVFRYFCDD